MKRVVLIAAALVATAAVGAGGGAATYGALSSHDAPATVRQVTVRDSEPAADAGALSVTDIYERTRKGVVEITVSSTRAGPSPFGGEQTQRALGSGFVYDDQGHIVTNEHVVDGADSVSVRFWNGETAEARVVGSDASTDLAVIKVDPSSTDLTPLPLADSSSVAVGEGVVAIGSPFGLEGTVTSGIVSALHRQMTAPNNFAINDAIQTDAAINHGNSGGPLLDAQAKVIGVNALIESDSGGNDGVGFAIPSDTVAATASQLISSGTVEHAYLGVGLATIRRSVAPELGLVEGVEVTEVRSGTPAAEAGLRAATGSRTVAGSDYPIGGDVITGVDGRRITSAEELQAAIDAKRPGDTVSLTYVRDGAGHTVELRLATRPA